MNNTLYGSKILDCIDKINIDFFQNQITRIIKFLELNFEERLCLSLSSFSSLSSSFGLKIHATMHSTDKVKMRNITDAITIT